MTRNVILQAGKLGSIIVEWKIIRSNCYLQILEGRAMIPEAGILQEVYEKFRMLAPPCFQKTQ